MRKLLEVLHRLTDLGNTVVIIEHNLDVIRNADWILDMGPEGGEDGGLVVAKGRPGEIARVSASHTGSFLARYYAAHGEPSDVLTEDVEETPQIAAVEVPEKTSVRTKKKAKKPANGKTGKTPRETKKSPRKADR